MSFLDKAIEQVKGNQVYSPVPIDKTTAIALQAIMQGKANAVQQQRVMSWIIFDVSNYYDLSWRPGPDGDRETSFAEGRRFVGAQIIKCSKIKASELKGGTYVHSKVP